jgi:hypothetical protein
LCCVHREPCNRATSATVPGTELVWLAETHAKLQELAAAFPRKRSAILRYVMQWGLTQTRGGTIDQSIPTTVQLVPLLMEPDLLQQVQDAAAAHGTSVVAWVRHALRQVTGADFPPSWHEEAARGRMTRATMASASCCGWIPRRVRGWRIWSITSTGRTPKSSASSSPRQSQGIFPRAGSWPRRKTASDEPHRGTASGRHR